MTIKEESIEKTYSNANYSYIAIDAQYEKNETITISINYIAPVVAFVYTVWVYLKAMIIEKTIKYEPTNKYYFNDNYSYSAPASLLYIYLLPMDPLKLLLV